jgi:hypothetical protein
MSDKDKAPIYPQKEHNGREIGWVKVNFKQVGRQMVQLEEHEHLWYYKDEHRLTSPIKPR